MQSSLGIADIEQKAIFSTIPSSTISSLARAELVKPFPSLTIIAVKSSEGI